MKTVMFVMSQTIL